MKKKTVRTIENEYNEDGNLIKSTETIVEEDVCTITPQKYPSGTTPYVSDTEIFMNKRPMSVNYD